MTTAQLTGGRWYWWRRDASQASRSRVSYTIARPSLFNEFGGKPQSVMEDVNTGVQQPSGTKSDTGAVWGRRVAPRLESVNVQALLAALPGRLTTMQSLVEFLGTGRVLQVIEQRGAHYYLTGKGVGYVEITEAIGRIRSNLMRGLDERARAQMASKGGAGVYRIRSSDVTIYRYAKGVREPWRVRHIEVPIITTQEFSGANMWVREVGDKGDRVHVEPRTQRQRDSRRTPGTSSPRQWGTPTRRSRAPAARSSPASRLTDRSRASSPRRFRPSSGTRAT